MQSGDYAFKKNTFVLFFWVIFYFCINLAKSHKWDTFYDGESGNIIRFYIFRSLLEKCGTNNVF